MTQATKEEISRILKEESERIRWGKVLIEATVQDGEITTVQFETKRTVKT